ncbi:hypothetical protein [Hydrogenophaga sp.]|uniref:hypothetical protein n=1 Tax=Hydrogenophaga sp. TaxID=1904254 RepID=UPI003F6FB235
MQYAVSIRDAQNNAVETDIGTSPIFRVYNGTAPANVAAALSGNTLLAEGTLPSDFMGASSAGVKAKAGTWTLTGQSGAGSGTAGTFFRIYASDGTTAKVQGTFGVGQEAVPDNNNIANGQSVNVATFSITRGNG